MESEKYNKLVNILIKKRLTDNKLLVTIGEKEEGRGNTGVRN